MVGETAMKTLFEQTAKSSRNNYVNAYTQPIQTCTVTYNFSYVPTVSYILCTF